MKMDIAMSNAEFARRQRYYVIIEKPRRELSTYPAHADPEVERMLYIVNKNGLLKRQGLWDHFVSFGYKIKVLKRQAAMKYKFDLTKKG